MKPDLSIIIPCYNCSKTLEEAVNSCFTQGLAEASFNYEIIMVDDGSVDSTRQVMDKLVRESELVKNCKVYAYSHEKNKGGGATRNTAIGYAKADIIFCLDSDDMLVKETLLKMFTFFINKRKEGKKCDGVGIHRSIKFKGDNINNVDVIHTFGYVDQVIPFTALQQNDGIYCSLYSTFMHSKESFEVMGGYPTDHGFDTQSFAWRFLANGFTAYTCPEAEYLHRVQFTKSYYIREYESGKLNHNWYKIFEEFLYFFNNEMQFEILTFNLNSSTNFISDLINKRSNVFKENYKDFIKNNSASEYEKLLENKVDNSIGDIYWLAVRKFGNKKYEEAFTLFEKIIKNGLKNGYSHNYLKTISEILNKKSDLINNDLINETFSYKKQGSQVNIIARIIRKVIRIFKDNLKKANYVRKIYYFPLGIKNNLINYLREKNDYKEYRDSIAKIIKNKEFILDIDWGGLGDILVYTSLPRLLKEKYNIDFYLSENCKKISRNPDTLKMCFEMNPYFKGYKNQNGFKYAKFSRDRSILNLLLDINGDDIVKGIHKQFGLTGKALPELYYKPNLLAEYKDTILVDINYISGHKQGLVYDMSKIKKYAESLSKDENMIKYVVPKDQDLFKYADMIHSSKEFITVLSGGAALAVTLNKKATVFLPENTRGETMYNFTFLDSNVKYK